VLTLPAGQFRTLTSGGFRAGHSELPVAPVSCYDRQAHDRPKLIALFAAVAKLKLLSP